MEKVETYLFAKQIQNKKDKYLFYLFCSDKPTYISDDIYSDDIYIGMGEIKGYHFFNENLESIKLQDYIDIDYGLCHPNDQFIEFINSKRNLSEHNEKYYYIINFIDSFYYEVLLVENKGVIQYVKEKIFSVEDNYEIQFYDTPFLDSLEESDKIIRSILSNFSELLFNPNKNIIKKSNSKLYNLYSDNLIFM